MKPLVQAHVLKDIGSRIAELRAVAGLTQEEMAGRLDVSTRYFQAVEGGQENLTIGTLVKFANALGVELPEFLKAPAKTKPRRRHPTSKRARKR